MTNNKVLVMGACGQIGVELTLALRQIHGISNVIATDIRHAHPLLAGGPYEILDVMDENAIYELVRREGITEIYLLAALLSATGEKAPLKAWDINMRSLLSVLEIGVQEKIKKIFWPSSIAIFGSTTPGENTSQQTISEPETVYGISKYAGELWCQYYHQRWGLDVRSIRYPGLISYKTQPGGGTTDYAVEIYHEAIKSGRYTSFLKAGTYLPMMYMEDAIRATLQIMQAPTESLSTRMAYNVSAMSFDPEEIAAAIKKHMPKFTLQYKPDYRQKIAEAWPASIDDSLAKKDWDWSPKWDLDSMTADMLEHLK